MSEKTRKQLERDALNAGVAHPDQLPNKDAVVEAIDAPNPALAPVPEPPSTEPRSYRVTGTQAVHGHAPGKTFTALLTPEQEQFLLGGGHITTTEKD